MGNRHFADALIWASLVSPAARFPVKLGVFAVGADAVDVGYRAFNGIDPVGSLAERAVLWRVGKFDPANMQPVLVFFRDGNAYFGRGKRVAASDEHSASSYNLGHDFKLEACRLRSKLTLLLWQEWVEGGR